MHTTHWASAVPHGVVFSFRIYATYEARRSFFFWFSRFSMLFFLPYNFVDGQESIELVMVGRCWVSVKCVVLSPHYSFCSYRVLFWRHTNMCGNDRLICYVCCGRGCECKRNLCGKRYAVGAQLLMAMIIIDLVACEWVYVRDIYLKENGTIHVERRRMSCVQIPILRDCCHYANEYLLRNDCVEFQLKHTLPAAHFPDARRYKYKNCTRKIERPIYWHFDRLFIQKRVIMCISVSG